MFVKQRGDTIVEVMIVLAILGLALGIAYSTANRSLQNTEQAEESAQATRYVQTEVETLYGLAGQCGNVHLGGADCNGNTVNAPNYDNTPTDPTVSGNIFSWNEAFCSVDGTHLIAADSGDPAHPSACANYKGLYQLDIYYCDKDPSAALCNGTAVTPGTDTFIVQITWPDVGGQGTDSVTQSYRIHPGEGST